MGHRRRSLRIVTVLASVLVASTVATASAHEEREAHFPAGDGSVPSYRPPTATPRLVVCKPESATLIAAMSDAALRAWNEQLLAECAFEHIQAAVDAVTERGTTVYVLPGTYREEPSREPPAEECADLAGESMLEYDEHLRCPHLQNLIVILGDGEAGDDDFGCNTVRCDLQLEGTGATPEQVVIDGGYTPEGEYEKLNGIRADRADGVYLRNLTVQRFEFNAVYILETDGFVIDRVLARWNDEYGFLTFAVDHGLYTHCEAYGNGDAGIYPGSASDINRDEGFEPLRFAVEITGCRSHHNAIGYSGTAGNSVYAHDNDFFMNATGVTMDSVFPGHPGLPQNHAWFLGNRIYANNVNYYRYVHDGTCAKPPAERGYEQGVVCPVAPVPVGTGLLVAGGNYNLFRDNQVWDNWRQGFMLFHVPAPIRDSFNPDEQFDTSHFNRFVGNTLGRSPGGLRQPNGLDFWWDEQGEGNCWQDNVAPGGSITSDPGHLPDCANPSEVFRRFVWNVAKSASITGCAFYSRSDNPEPEGCDWFETPPEPAGRQDGTTQPAPGDDPPSDAAAVEAPPALPATGSAGLSALALASLAAARLLRGRRTG